jgi:transcriptional regulator with XRE-family HTH domain
MVGVATMAKDSGSNDEPPDSKDDSEPTPESSVRFDPASRRRQEDLGKTLEEISERSGLTPNYTGIVENGDASLSALTALVTGLGAPDGESLEREPTFCAMVCEVAKLSHQPSPMMREAINTMLRAITKRRRTKAATRT